MHYNTLHKQKFSHIHTHGTVLRFIRNHPLLSLGAPRCLCLASERIQRWTNRVQWSADSRHQQLCLIHIHEWQSACLSPHSLSNQLLQSCNSDNQSQCTDTCQSATSYHPLTTFWANQCTSPTHSLASNQLKWIDLIGCKKSSELTTHG